MKVGFLSNQLDNRGTGNAMFDYAKYNRELLGNESKIYTFQQGSHSFWAADRFQKEFEDITVLPNMKSVEEIEGIDVLYHIKYGTPDGVRTNPTVRYAVHSVFANDPHGDRYATVSSWLSGGSNTPFVPHIIHLPELDEDLRESLGIPKNAIVFGRYGALDTFDIPWVWNVIEKILKRYANAWFIFANTNRVYSNPRIIYLDELKDADEKVKFINTCNYMLHARGRGETFGISVGEFALKGKPIITYNLSTERAHIEELQYPASHFSYDDIFDLYTTLGYLLAIVPIQVFAYTQYTPELVMQKFGEVFLG